MGKLIVEGEDDFTREINQLLYDQAHKNPRSGEELAVIFNRMYVEIQRLRDRVKMLEEASRGTENVEGSARAYLEHLYKSDYNKWVLTGPHKWPELASQVQPPEGEA